MSIQVLCILRIRSVIKVTNLSHRILSLNQIVFSFQLGDPHYELYNISWMTLWFSINRFFCRVAIFIACCDCNKLNAFMKRYAILWKYRISFWHVSWWMFGIFSFSLIYDLWYDSDIQHISLTHIELNTPFDLVIKSLVKICLI